MADHLELPADIFEAICPVRRESSRSPSQSRSSSHGKFPPSPRFALISTIPENSKADVDFEERKRSIYRDSFNKYDTDKSGTIDYSEFKNLISDLKWQLTEQEITDLLLELDNDKNGVIELNEFLRWSAISWKTRVSKWHHEEFSVPASPLLKPKKLETFDQIVAEGDESICLDE